MKNALPVLLTVVLSFEASAQEPLTVEGVAELASNTFGSAPVDQLKKQAEGLALFNAVENAAKPLLASDAPPVQQHLTQLILKRNAATYVKSFDAEPQSGSSKSKVTVRIKAVIDQDTLAKDLAAARPLVNRLIQRPVVVSIKDEVINEKGVQLQVKLFGGVLAERFGRLRSTVIDSEAAPGQTAARVASARVGSIVKGTALIQFVPPSKDPPMPQVDGSGQQFMFPITGLPGLVLRPRGTRGRAWLAVRRPRGSLSEGDHHLVPQNIIRGGARQCRRDRVAIA